MKFLRFLIFFLELFRLGSEVGSFRSDVSDKNRKSVYEIKAGFEVRPETSSKQKDYVGPSKIPSDSPNSSKKRRSVPPSSDFQERANMLENFLKPSSSSSSDNNRQTTKLSSPQTDVGNCSTVKEKDVATTSTAADSSQITGLVPKIYFGGFIDEKKKAEAAAAAASKNNKSNIRQNEGFLPVGSFVPVQNGEVASMNGAGVVRKIIPPPEPPIDYDLESPKKKKEIQQTNVVVANGNLPNGAVKGGKFLGEVF